MYILFIIYICKYKLHNFDYLAEQLAGVEIKEMPEVIQSEMGQKQKLQRVLDMINRILQMPPNWHNTKWSVDSKYNLVLNVEIECSILV